MTNPTTLNAFSTLSPELQQHILGRVGEPATTSKVSRAWQLQTREVVKSELRQVFQHLNPGQPYDLVVDLPAIKEIYRQTLNSVPQDIAPHLPRV
ncbi:MAG: hypothetical protein KAR79_00300, partial [Simkaniaceae bacterium]|nr:hypothetical protein [Simkaniaceae bacterium]